MNDERRKHDRVPVRTIVRMQFETIGEFLQSYAQNISTGGMQLAVAQKLEPDDPIALEFKLKSDYPLIQGTAIVRWCEPSGDHHLIGVEFYELDDRSRATIEEALRMNEGAASSSSMSMEAEELDAGDLLAPPEEDAFSLELDGFGTPDAGSAEEVDAFLLPDEDDVEPEIESLELPDIPAEPSAVPDAESMDFSDVSADIESMDIEMPEEQDAPSSDADVGALFEDTSVETDVSDPEPHAEHVEQLDFGTDFGQNDPTLTDPGMGAMPSVDSGTGKKKKLLVGGVLLLLLLGAGAWVVFSGGGGSQQADLPPIESDRAAMPIPVTAPEPATETAEAEDTTTAAAALEKAAPEALVPEPAPEPESAQPAAVISRPDPKPTPVPQPGAAVSRVERVQSGQGGVWVTIVGNGSFDGQFKYFGLSNPPRAVIDILDADMGKQTGAGLAADHANVQRVRVGKHPGKVRIVLDLVADRGFEAVPEGSTLVVRAK